MVGSFVAEGDQAICRARARVSGARGPVFEARRRQRIQGESVHDRAARNGSSLSRKVAAVTIVVDVSLSAEVRCPLCSRRLGEKVHVEGDVVLGHSNVNIVAVELAAVRQRAPASRVFKAGEGYRPSSYIGCSGWLC